ncbi:MAG: preprotein translocase subunit SecY [Clostridia bacterium]|nr:preprotein translocase subunit SecY [Clostridia bacterium]
MFKTLVNAFKDASVRKKILWTLFILFIYRLGCYIPVPGLNPDSIAAAVGGNSLAGDSALVGVISAVTGGAFSTGTIFALGIVPYINASIIMQLLTMVIPVFSRWSKEGEEGRKKISKATRVASLILAAIQAVGVVLSWKNSSAITSNMFGSVEATCIVVGLILVAGSSLCMWLGERITQLGIGNGTSLIIFVGILSTAGTALWQSIINLGSGASIWELIIFVAVVLVIFGVIVWMDLSERRIPVQYAKQVKGNKMYGGQNTHIPIRINASGVMPIIFASALLMFPQMIASFWPDSGFYAFMVGPTWSWISIVLTALLIVFFAFFYAQMQFNPDDVARNIQQYGGTIVGVRPGKNTSDYLKKINNRITLFGAIFLAILALIPGVLFTAIDTTGLLSGAFTATGMLIVVSVALEFDKQLEAQLMMKHYKGFLK